MPTFIMYKAIESGTLIPLLTEYQFSQLAAYASVRAFVDFLVKRFEGLPDWDLCMQDANHAFKNSDSITLQNNSDQFNYTNLEES